MQRSAAAHSASLLQLSDGTQMQLGQPSRSSKSAFVLAGHGSQVGGQPATAAMLRMALQPQTDPSWQSACTVQAGAPGTLGTGSIGRRSPGSQLPAAPHGALCKITWVGASQPGASIPKERTQIIRLGTRMVVTGRQLE